MKRTRTLSRFTPKCGDGHLTATSVSHLFTTRGAIPSTTWHILPTTPYSHHRPPWRSRLRLKRFPERHLTCATARPRVRQRAPIHRVTIESSDWSANQLLRPSPMKRLE